jgi:acetyl esterase/lipase
MKAFLALVCLALSAGAQTPAVPSDVVLERDVAYSTAGGERLALDIARPKDGAKHPVVLCIHGGGFRGGNRATWLPLCLRLAQHGYVAATISYRLAPRSPFPAALQDSKTAVRWLRANAAKYGIDVSRVGVMGDSAGGNLALMLGLTSGVAEFEGEGNPEQSSRVQCVADYYGPTDLTKSYGKSVDAAEVLPLYLGGDLAHARQAHVRASPLYWVTPDAAPVLALHGTKDRYVEYAQSLWLQDRMRAAGISFELETLEGADHGFKGSDAQRAEARTAAFFDVMLGRR